MSDEELLVDRRGAVAVVTMNRPAVRNALSSTLIRSLGEVLPQLDVDAEVAVIVLTGADPAFSAGLDLKELGSTGGNLGASAVEARGPWPTLKTPLIGAVNGVAVTGGLELALNCDFLIASERAAFADTHARVGVMPGWGLSVLLPEAVGVRRARQMSLTGNYVSAETALAWGLVNEVVPHEQVVERAVALGEDIAGNDPAGVRQMLATYAATSATTVAEGWEIEARMGRAWSPRISPEEVERRRAGIMERGRDQTS